MKIIFACPSYGPLEPEAVISQRVAIMHACTHGHELIGDISPNRSAWTVARNTIAKQAVESEADAVFWADSDVILPMQTITWLADYCAAHDKDFLCGIYFQRHPPHFPLVAHYQPPPRDSFAWFVEWPPNVIAPIDGCGFGCVITTTRLLRAIGSDWFSYEKFSEDFDFCRKATKAGFQLYVHTGLICGHLKDPQPATIEDFRRAWADETRKLGDAATNRAGLDSSSAA